MLVSYLLISVQVRQNSTGHGTSECVVAHVAFMLLAYQFISMQVKHNTTGHSRSVLTLLDLICAGKAEDNRPWYKWVCSYATYVLLLMLLTYLLNQLDRYMLAITSQPLARDVHFGDKACAKNETLPASATKGIACNATEAARYACVTCALVVDGQCTAKSVC